VGMWASGQHTKRSKAKQSQAKHCISWEERGNGVDCSETA
jgi:hypothetical protein